MFSVDIVGGRVYPVLFCYIVKKIGSWCKKLRHRSLLWVGVMCQVQSGSNVWVALKGIALLEAASFLPISTSNILEDRWIKSFVPQLHTPTFSIDQSLCCHTGHRGNFHHWCQALPGLPICGKWSMFSSLTVYCSWVVHRGPVDTDVKTLGAWCLRFFVRFKQV